MAATSKQQLDYIKGYNKENYVIIRVQVNKRIESDLLEHLNSQSNKSGYIKSLILKDMNK